MRTSHLGSLHGAALLALPLAAVFSAGCSADIHDNVVNIPNATFNANVDVDADVDVNNIMPEQVVPLTVNVENVYLVPPDVTPPAEHMNDAGHINVYMDSTSNPPILVTAEAHVMVKIPKDTKPGKHKLICRLHRHDDMPTSKKTEIEIDVKASVSIGGTGGASGSGGVSGTGGASGSGGASGTGGSSGGTVDPTASGGASGTATGTGGAAAGGAGGAA